MKAVCLLAVVGLLLFSAAADDSSEASETSAETSETSAEADSTAFVTFEFDPLMKVELSYYVTSVFNWFFDSANTVILTDMVNVTCGRNSDAYHICYYELTWAETSCEKNITSNANETLVEGARRKKRSKNSKKKKTITNAAECNPFVAKTPEVTYQAYITELDAGTSTNYTILLPSTDVRQSLYYMYEYHPYYTGEDQTYSQEVGSS